MAEPVYIPKQLGGEVGRLTLALLNSIVKRITEASGILWSQIDFNGSKLSDLHERTFANLTDTPTTVSGYGITDAVPTSRTVTAGVGLTGGGSLAANVSLVLSVATTAQIGGVMKAAAVADIATPDATDEASAITLANANKAKINALLAALRTSGALSS